MKTRWSLGVVFILAIVMAAAPAGAGMRARFFCPRPYPYHHYRPCPPYFYHYHYYCRGSEEIFFGALVGFTLGTLLAPPPPPVYIYRQYPPAVFYEERYILVPEKRIQRESVSSLPAAAAGDPSCLQTREYTTTVVIEGKEVEAYGTKCLRPDGTWSYGPARPVPND